MFASHYLVFQSLVRENDNNAKSIYSHLAKMHELLIQEPKGPLWSHKPSASLTCSPRAASVQSVNSEGSDAVLV